MQSRIPSSFLELFSASNVNHQVSSGLKIVTFAVFIALIINLSTGKIRLRAAQEI